MTEQIDAIEITPERVKAAEDAVSDLISRYGEDIVTHYQELVPELVAVVLRSCLPDLSGARERY